MNTIVLMGRLTADPELQHTGNDLSVTNFSVAVDRPMSKEKTTDFINVVAWRKTAEFITKYFHKGSMILIRGSLQMRRYEDKEGNKRTAYDVVAETVEFCGGKNENSHNSVATKPNASYKKGVDEGVDYNPVESDDDDDDLPF